MRPSSSRLLIVRGIAMEEKETAEYRPSHEEPSLRVLRGDAEQPHRVTAQHCHAIVIAQPRCVEDVVD